MILSVDSMMISNQLAQWEEFCAHHTHTHSHTHAHPPHTHTHSVRREQRPYRVKGGGLKLSPPKKRGGKANSIQKEKWEGTLKKRERGIEAAIKRRKSVMG